MKNKDTIIQIKRIIKDKTVEGLIWNYISLFVMAGSGLIFDLLIMIFYDVIDLGIFNRVYAWYIVLSQIGVWGIHMSVLRYTPEQTDVGKRNELLSSALVTVTIISMLFTCTMELIVKIVVEEGTFCSSVQRVLPAIVFFSINKVLLNYINGLSQMKAYAVFQSLRYIFIAIFILWCGEIHLKADYLSFCFGFSELLLFLIMSIYLIIDKVRFKAPTYEWVKNHLYFGTSILPANMIMELNSKVDIICLGALLNDDYAIGVYSFAVLFVEGFYQLYIVIRRMINPQIAKTGTGKIKEYINETNKTILKYINYASPVIVILLLGVFYVICFVTNHFEYSKGIIYLVIISLSIAINSRMIIWGNILAQLGYPKDESKVNVVTVLSNLVLNIILIVMFGAVGAAIATAISYIIYSIMLNYYCKKRIDVSLFI